MLGNTGMAACHNTNVCGYREVRHAVLIHRPLLDNW